VSTAPGVRVVVTSAGSAPAVAVIQALKAQREIPVRIVAADMDPLSVGFQLADDFALIPCASHPEYVAQLLELCRRSHATALFPIIDEELQKVADAASDFVSRGVSVITNSPEAVRTARDKWLTFKWCRSQDVLTPESWLVNDPTFPRVFPMVLKPRSGRGSVGVEIVRSERELEFYLARGGDLMIQQWIDGTEYTVDILGDRLGRVLSAVPRERLVTKAGMCVKGRTTRRAELLDLAVAVAERFPLTPRGNLQFKQSMQDRRYYLIEVNPKFGAGLPLTTAAGVNMPLLLLKMSLGAAVSPRIGEFRDGLVMLRHWAECFVASEELPQPGMTGIR
jgi:carbamoyl-phosphate synthase large subunit